MSQICSLLAICSTLVWAAIPCPLGACNDITADLPASTLVFLRSFLNPAAHWVHAPQWLNCSMPFGHFPSHSNLQGLTKIGPWYLFYFISMTFSLIHSAPATLIPLLFWTCQEHTLSESLCAGLISLPLNSLPSSIFMLISRELWV